MKLHVPLVCYLVAGLATSAVAQLAPATAGEVKHNFMLDVQNMGAGGGTSLGNTGGLGNNNTNRPNETSATSSQSRTAKHSTTLQITVRNLSSAPDKVKVEWYFIGKAATGHGGDSIVDSGNKDITIQQVGQEVFTITSKVVESSRVTTQTATTTNLPGGKRSTTYTDKTTEKGEKLSGWMVRILVDGKPVQARGSDFKYEDAGMNEDKFSELKKGN